MHVSYADNGLQYYGNTTGVDGAPDQNEVPPDWVQKEISKRVSAEGDKDPGAAYDAEVRWIEFVGRWTVRKTSANSGTTTFKGAIEVLVYYYWDILRTPAASISNLDPEEADQLVNTIIRRNYTFSPITISWEWVEVSTELDKMVFMPSGRNGGTNLAGGLPWTGERVALGGDGRVVAASPRGSAHGERVETIGGERSHRSAAGGVARADRAAAESRPGGLVRLSMPQGTFTTSDTPANFTFAPGAGRAF